MSDRGREGVDFWSSAPALSSDTSQRRKRLTSGF
jgi:hypothetical protein